MHLTINVPDEFAVVATNIGLTPSAYLLALANQEIINYFKERKLSREQNQTPQKNLLLG